MTWHIYQLIDYTTSEIIPYEPSLAPQVAEIVSAQARAAEAARLAAVREKLAGLLPVTTARQPTGDSLCVSLFPGLKPAPEGE